MKLFLRRVLNLLFVLLVGVTCGVATHKLLENSLERCVHSAQALLQWLRVPAPSQESTSLAISCLISLSVVVLVHLFFRKWITIWRLKHVWLSSLFLLFVVLCTAYFGLFQSPEGRDFVVTLAASLRADNLQSPNRRPQIWSSLLHLLSEFPVLIIGCKFDYLCLNKLLHHELGPVFPSKQGIAVASHHGVKAVLTSTNQPRGHFIGANVSPDGCMLPDTLIYLSTGHKHSRIRQLLLHAIPAFTSSDASHNAAFEDHAAASAGDAVHPSLPPAPYQRASQDVVRRCVADINLCDIISTCNLNHHLYPPPAQTQSSASCV
jgi:hypothetical protein